MEMTQFAMVQEMAHLVKDNLLSKHLVLSTEEALVQFLQDGTCPDRVLELEPMSAYHRLLLHRLAEIFGVSHESVGEGDERHLVIERCSDSSIPPILVSDILWDEDDYQPTTATHVLRRKDPPGLIDKLQPISPLRTIEEKKMAYFAARERIFALHGNGDKEHGQHKHRNVPIVARRMIAHALGQRISSRSHPIAENKEDGTYIDVSTAKKEVPVRLIQNVCKNIQSSPSEKLQERMAHNKYTVRNISSCTLHTQRELGVANSIGYASNNKVIFDDDAPKVMGTLVNVEKEQVGAAKRMFAHALGIPCRKG